MRLSLTIFITIFAFTHLSAQWEKLNEGLPGTINSIDFVNETGWFAGHNGTLVKTSDNGETWQIIPISEDLYFDYIDFVTASDGWAIGRTAITGSYPDSTVFLKTIDGGLSWSVKFKYTLNVFNSVNAVDQDHAFFAGGNFIYKTTDGGRTWININPVNLTGNYTSSWFGDSLNGVVAGSRYLGFVSKGLILKTSDGGSTWEEVLSDSLTYISNLQFTDSNTGYFRASFDSKYYLCKTEDRCSTWSVLLESPYFIYSHHFLNSNTAYILMNDSTRVKKVFKSIDGGLTWNSISGQLNNLNKIYFSSSETGFAVEEILMLSDVRTTSIYKTTDSGNNWLQQKLTFPFNKIHFFDKNYGIMFGGYEILGMHVINYEGRIFSTDDGGVHWKTNQVSNTSTYISSAFPDRLNGYYLSRSSPREWAFNSEIYKTSNGGINWVLCYKNSGTLILNELFAYNTTKVWVTGSECDSINGCGPVILATTNGGTQWKVEWKEFSSVILNSIYFSGNTGWAVGTEGTILRHELLTGWKKLQPVTDLQLKNAFSLGDNNCWIAGGYSYYNDHQPVFLKTSNGGFTWEINKKLPYLINDLYFLDSQRGWAVGHDSLNKGVILKTIDGGNNWTAVVDNLMGALNSIYIKDNYAWTVGRYGLVLRTKNPDPSGVDDDPEYPADYQLWQNYPNPFNPSTTISWEIPSGDIVSLKVYDVLGNVMDVLINEYKPAGKYRVTWTADKFSSGVYFYQLIIGDIIKTKKMTFIK
jgi:photosystem II stability/assembly factor-like uncharacterized protein